jgi:hypothetical protein
MAKKKLCSLKKQINTFLMHIQIYRKKMLLKNDQYLSKYFFNNFLAQVFKYFF